MVWNAHMCGPNSSDTMAHIPTQHQANCNSMAPQSSTYVQKCKLEIEPMKQKGRLTTETLLYHICFPVFKRITKCIKF